MRRLGADKQSFDTIAAAGPNAACPASHSNGRCVENRPTPQTRLRGSSAQIQTPDITRTICLGKATDDQEKVYQIVLDAQRKAIEAIAPRRTGKETDAVARDYITSQGWGAKLGHGLGHALGIEVHDGPAFSKISKIILAPGMVVTVEPGIYIEDWGGIRHRRRRSHDGDRGRGDNERRQT